MKILVFGATGFIGQKLVHQLFLEGHEINVISRSSEKAQQTLAYPFQFFEWNKLDELPPKNAFEGVETIINLSGESVQGRWNEEKKKRLKSSRIEYVKKIHERVSQLEQKPTQYIGASAIGFYGDRGEETLSEDSQAGNGFMPQLCKDWEVGTESFKKLEIKCSIVRIGIVLGVEDGALKQMLTPFTLGVGGPLGSGKQWMSWIHIDDLINQFLLLLNKKIEGVFNGTSPNPVRGTHFSKNLAKTVNRPSLFPVPKIAIKTLFGEMSDIILSSQRVIPEGFNKLDFKFKYPKLTDALTDLLRPYKNQFAYSLTTHQWFPLKKEELFDFFSDAKNLEAITPPWVNFKILNVSTDKIQEGTILDYQIKLHTIPIKWKTKIIDWNPPTEFVDTQLKGPYKLWHHTHSFKEVAGGVLMTDRVLYQIPFSIIGNLANPLLVDKDVQKIFAYRKVILAKLLKS